MNRKITLVLAALLVFSSFIIAGCQNNQNTEIAINNSTDVGNFEIDINSIKNKVANEENIKLIDVRTPEEYEIEHLENSELVPLQSLENNISNVEGLEKNDEIIVYCRSGRRSTEAYNILKALGYTNVKSMAGGINAWNSQGYKVCAGDHLTC
jgi:rhodanese-related sulfurtransferase